MRCRKGLLARCTRSRVALLLLLGVAAGSRLAWVALVEVETRQLHHDVVWYAFHAETLASGQGIVDANGAPTAAYPPGYPILLAVAYRLLGTGQRTIGILNVALSTATCLFVFGLARRAYGPPVAYVAATLFAICPGDIFYAGLSFSEVAFQCFFVASLLAFLACNQSPQEPRAAAWAGFGLLLGAASLVRGAALPFLPVAIGARWMVSSSRRVPVRMVAFSTLGFLLAVGPWFVRNALVMDAPFLFAADGSRALVIGHSPVSTGTQTPAIEPFLKQQFPQLDALPAPRAEVERARLEATYAVRWALSNPIQELALVPLKLSWLYEGDHVALVYYARAYTHVRGVGGRNVGRPDSLWFAILTRVADAYFTGLLVLSLIGVTRTLSAGARATAIVPLSLLYFDLLHGVVLFGHPRFHASFLPLLTLLAALAIDGRRRPWRLGAT